MKKEYTLMFAAMEENVKKDIREFFDEILKFYNIVLSSQEEKEKFEKYFMIGYHTFLLKNKKIGV